MTISDSEILEDAGSLLTPYNFYFKIPQIGDIITFVHFFVYLT